MNKREILEMVNNCLSSKDLNISERLAKVCESLKQNIGHYDWVGFYFAEHSSRTLHLGPYAGDPTDHKVIPFGKGICGQVAESNETFLVDNVHAQDNYIACSIYVKSEIVVPLFLNGENIGQIDIDSNTINAFSKQDEDLLKQVNIMVAKTIECEKVNLKAIRI